MASCLQTLFQCVAKLTIQLDTHFGVRVSAETIIHFDQRVHRASERHMWARMMIFLVVGGF